MASYKQKCNKCKKNFVLVSGRNTYVVCHDCQKADLAKEITDPEMKKFFDLPEEYYKENNFLRNIKIAYLRYGKLTEKQKAAFEKTVAKIKEEKNS